jgi:hypothetical protein
LPANVEKPIKLETTKLNDLCFSDEFWELDTSFKSRGKWVLDSRVRKAVDAMYHYERALEEISILGDEADRYYTWLASRLVRCESLLSVIDTDSLIGTEILKFGLKAADALGRLGGLVAVNLGDGDRFKSVQEKINCTSCECIYADSSDK